MRHTYDRSRFKTIMVPMDVYLRLSAKKTGPLDSLGQVIRRLLDENESLHLEPTKVVREISHEGPKIARFLVSPVMCYASKPTKVKIKNE